jgi:hypothetical protein
LRGAQPIDLVFQAPVAQWIERSPPEQSAKPLWPGFTGVFAAQMRQS